MYRSILCLRNEKQSLIENEERYNDIPGLERLRGERFFDLDRDLLRRGERDRLCR